MPVLLLVLDYMILRRKKDVYYTFYIIKNNLYSIDYIYYYYYYYYFIHLSALHYEDLLAIRLGKPFIDKTLDTLPLLFSYTPLYLLIACCCHCILYSL